MRRWACAMILATASAAHAHPDVDQALAEYEAVELEAALDTLARAEAGDGLSLDELGLLYELRALIHFARGDEDAVDVALRALARAHPEHDFSQRSPPALRQRFAAIRGGVDPVALRLSEEEGVVVAVITAGAEAVREVRLHHREVGGVAATEAGMAPRWSLGGVAVEVWAEAVGPGGAILASAGSETQPRAFGVVEEEETEEGGPGLGVWLGIAGGVAAVAVVVILAVTLSGGDDERIQPSAPMFRF